MRRVVVAALTVGLLVGCTPAARVEPTRVTDGLLADDPASYLGQHLVTNALLVPSSAPVCTTETCAPADPCCNTCTQPFRVAGLLPVQLKSAPDERFECAGSNCNPNTRCTPLKDLLTARFDLVGEVAHDAHEKERFVFRVDSAVVASPVASPLPAAPSPANAAPPVEAHR